MSSVGQGVGAIVGGVVGFFTLGGPTGALQGASYGAAIGGILDPADLPGYEGPRLSDASEQTSGYGVGLVEADGKIRISPHCIWIENNSRREVVRKEERDGKGGGSQETTTYEYYGTAAFLLTDHQIQAIERVWTSKGLLINAGGTDIDTAMSTNEIFPLAHLYNASTENQLKAALQLTPSPGPKGQIRIYPGFDDQMPDPRMEADLGVGNTPAYRGCAVLYIYDFPLPQEYGQSIAGIQFAIEVIVGGNDGAAVLLNQIAVDTPSGFIDPYCQYLTPDLARLYYANGLPVPETPATAFGVIDVGPHGEQPGGVTFAATSSNQTGGRGLTDTDIGVIGLSDAVNLISAFPGRLSISGAHFARKGAQGSGVWFAVTSTQNLYVGFESDDTTDVVALGAACLNVAIDDDGNCIVLFNNSLRVYDQSLTLLRTIDTTSTIGAGMSFNFVWMTYDSGILYVGKSLGNHPGSIYPFDMDAETVGSVVTLRDLTAVYPGTTIDEGRSNFNVSGSILTRFTANFGSSGAAAIGGDALIEHYRMPTPGADGEDLATVVRRRLERSELIESADIDVTDLSGTVRGYKTQGAGSVRQRIEPLMLTHHFDLIMSGYQLKAVTRGNSSVMTIDPDDLDARPYGTAPGVALGQSREMDTQLPSVVVVKALDKDRDYEINQQQSQTMAASKSVNVKEFTLTEVFTPAETASIAEVLWTRSWIERTPFKFNLPQTYRALEASDVVTLPMTYATYELYLTSVNYTLDNRVECEAVLNDSAIYTTNAVGGTGNVSTTIVPYGGTSVLMLMNLPALYDEYTGYGFPAGMCGYSSLWPGGLLAKSIDQGQSYQPLQSYSGPVVAGVVATPLAQDDGFVINYTDQLVVRFYSADMSISSITEAQMKSGQNWAAYGAEGRWEILLFANATDNGDGTFTLDTILRGAKGSEWATGLHEAYDQFVFLSDADMDFIGMDVNGYNVERLYKGITNGQAIGSVTAQAFTYTGVNLKPYAPTQLDASLSGSDWVMTWKRRSRSESSYFTNGVAVPLGEATEAYEIDIIDTSVSPSVVVNTYNATSETYTYSSADQTTDFGAPQSSITFRVYQISAVVGRGYESEATV